jgi:hypothetical protein
MSNDVTKLMSNFLRTKFSKSIGKVGAKREVSDKQKGIAVFFAS